MKILLVGTGGVGEAMAQMAQCRPWVEQMVLADYSVERACFVQRRLGDSKRFPVERVNAGIQSQVESLARQYQVDLIMNACAPTFNIPLFEASYSYGCTYMDMALSLSEPHPNDPYRQVGIKLGDYQFAQTERWEKKGILALVGVGVEPGLSDIFARYAQDHLFDEIDEIGVRDGANLTINGYAFAPTFSIWTTLEECLNPPVIWEKDRGWFTTELFSEPEVFNFPEGIGAVTCVNVEHEEVLMIPRWVNCKRVTFKYGLGEQFINVLKTLQLLGLANKEPIQVKDVKVAPRDVVAACLPNPAELGSKMEGKTCAGTWVTGRKDGQPRQLYLYQVADNQETMQKWGCQAVVAQTAFNAVIAWDLLQSGQWQGTGVLGPELFDPVPFLNKMADYGFPYGIQEMSSG